jgi:hypothetical protein
MELSTVAVEPDIRMLFNVNVPESGTSTGKVADAPPALNATN